MNIVVLWGVILFSLFRDIVVVGCAAAYLHVPYKFHPFMFLFSVAMMYFAVIGAMKFWDDFKIWQNGKVGVS